MTIEAKLTTLLNKRNLILLKIVNYIATDSRWFSISEISDAIQLVERSSQRYVNQLAELITQLDNPSLGLLLRKNKGVKLLVAETTNVSVLKSAIFKQDETVILLKDLILDEYHSLDEYLKATYSNRNTALTHLKKIEQLLASYGVTLSISKLSLGGSESAVRLLGYSLTWFLHKNDDWATVDTSLDNVKLESEVDQLISDLHLKLNLIEKKELLFTFAINIVRYRKKHPLDKQAVWPQLLPPESEFQATLAVRQLYAKFVIFDEVEVAFLTANMALRGYLYQINYLRDRFIQAHHDSQSEVYQATVFFLETFSSHFTTIPVEKHELFFLQAFRSHLFCAMYKQVDYDYNANSVVESIEEAFPHYYREFNEFIDYLHGVSRNPIFLERAFLMQRYFFLFSTIFPQAYLETKVSLSIQSDLPEILEERLEAFIINYFRYQFQLEFIKLPSFQAPDVIIANVYHHTTGPAMVVIDYPLSQRDIGKIEGAILKQLNKK